MLECKQMGEGVDCESVVEMFEGNLREVLFGMKDAVDVPEGFEAGVAEPRGDLLRGGVVGVFGVDVDRESVQARRVEGGIAA